MKSKMVLVISAALSILTISCATTKAQTINSTMNEATFDISSLSRDQYVIIGKVEGEGRITAKTSLIEKQTKSYAFGEPTYNNEDVSGDNGKYGFINSKIDTNMTVIDKAIAMASYKMIQAAKYNNADTVIYVTTTTTIVPNTYSTLSKESFVIAKVSGLAVKIKPDANVQVKMPTASELEQIDDVELEKIEDENAKKAKKSENQEAAANNGVTDSAKTEEVPVEKKEVKAESKAEENVESAEQDAATAEKTEKAASSVKSAKAE